MMPTITLLAPSTRFPATPATGGPHLRGGGHHLRDGHGDDGFGARLTVELRNAGRADRADAASGAGGEPDGGEPDGADRDERAAASDRDPSWSTPLLGRGTEDLTGRAPVVAPVVARADGAVTDAATDAPADAATTAPPDAAPPDAGSFDGAPTGAAPTGPGPSDVAAPDLAPTAVAWTDPVPADTAPGDDAVTEAAPAGRPPDAGTGADLTVPIAPPTATAAHLAASSAEPEPVADPRATDPTRVATAAVTATAVPPATTAPAAAAGAAAGATVPASGTDAPADPPHGPPADLGRGAAAPRDAATERSAVTAAAPEGHVAEAEGHVGVGAPLAASSVEVPHAAATRAAALPDAVQRVLDAVELLENAPPPRQITLELGEARVRIALEHGQVRLTFLGDHPDDAAELLRDARQALGERGFDLGGEGGRGREPDGDDDRHVAEPRLVGLDRPTRRVANGLRL